MNYRFGCHSSPQPAGLAGSDHLGVTGTLPVSPQILVENHRNGPHQHAAPARVGELGARDPLSAAQDARQGLEQLTDSTRLGLDKAEVALQSMGELRSGAVARLEVVERVMQRLADLHELALQATRIAA